MKVNEAENQKKESWFTHQKMYKSYQEIEKTAKTMQSKLKKSVEKARWVAWSFYIFMELPGMHVPCSSIFESYLPVITLYSIVIDYSLNWYFAPHGQQ